MLDPLLRKMAALSWRARTLWAVSRAHRKSMGHLRSHSSRKMLIVCYGNICRSPCAALLLHRQLAGAAEIRSAGFYPVPGRSSPPAYVAMCLRLGIDLTSHRSAVATPADFDWADLVVVMDRHNWQTARILGADPTKFVWLGTMDGDADIDDPYGLPEASAWEVVQRLQRCTETLARILLSRRSAAP